MATIYGLPACPCQVKWCPAYKDALARRGIVIRFVQLIGGAKKSGGTHSGGGADDFYLVSKPASMTWAEAWYTAIWVGRQMGSDARWRRPEDWDNQDGEEHGHGVLTDCPHNGPARYQIDDVRDGLDGLARHGRDTGPRPLSGRTWKQGIEWAKKQAKPPVKMRTTDLVFYQQNAASDKGGFTPRAAMIARQARRHDAHVMVNQELKSKYRPILSTALKGFMSMTSNHKNLVHYLKDNGKGLRKVGVARKWSLGNGRYALAVRYRHRNTGLDFVLVTFHLSWEHKAWRKRKAEATTIGQKMRDTWPTLPWVAIGDANDAHKDTKTRPDDTTCDVLEAFGFHDLYYDVPADRRKREQYNTANQGKNPPPSSGVHIDRFFGSASVKGRTWENDVLEEMTGNPAFDHWGQAMTVRITHPVKK